jgi:signal peptidase
MASFLRDSLKRSVATAETFVVQPVVQPTDDRPPAGRPARSELRRGARRRRNRHILKVSAGLVALALSAVVALSVVTFHLGVRAVLTGSMRPDYGPGAILLTERVPTSSIRPGMIVLFVPPGETSEFAHRIVSVSGPADAPIITTKGDANKTADPWHAQLTTPTVNRVIGSLPQLGRVLIALRGSGQILLAVVGGLLAAFGCARWALSPQRPPGRRTTAGTA